MLNKWTIKEINILKNCYGVELHRELLKLLPKRTSGAIYGKVYELGLKSYLKRGSYTGVRKRIYEVNDLYFNEPNLQNCYWAGFIAADGCIKKYNTVSIALCTKDINHLRRFKNDIHYNGKIFQYRMAELNIYSVPQWIEDLKNNFNITPRKTLTLKPPNLYKQHLINSFIIGYLDGDGCIYISHQKFKNKVYKYLHISFVGTHDMLSWIKENLNKIIPSKAKVIKCGRNIKAFQYSVCCDKALKIIKELRKIDVPRLDRKWEKISQ